MKPEDKDLLLADLCARLPYGVKYRTIGPSNFAFTLKWIDKLNRLDGEVRLENAKIFLRPMSSMTEDEARDIAILHGYNPVEILSTKVTDEYIDIILDDCVCSTITSTMWYDGIISSLECFDYLNKKMFDFRGLIPKDLAISTEEFNPYKH